MLGYREFTIDDYLAILRRRLWVILIPAVAGVLIAYGISLKLPNRYTSKTLILIEGQKVPDSFVKPVVTGDLTSRLSNIQQRILSRSQLEPIVTRLHLFPELADKATMEDLVNQLRKSISLTGTTPSIGAKEGELPGFLINVTLPSPQSAQQVCAEMASMLIGENAHQRQQSAQGTTSFLQSQLLDAKARLEEQDAKLAEFKTRYKGETPDEAQMNLNVLTNLNSRFDAVTQSLDRAQANKAYAQMLLRQQVTAWEAQRAGNNPHPETLEQQLATLESDLLGLRTRYTDDYPEVTKVMALIEGVKKKIAVAGTVKTTPSKKTDEVSAALEPLNVQQLRGEVHMYEQAIQEGTREQQKLQQAISLYQSRVQLSPAIEQKYRQITRDY